MKETVVKSDAEWRKQLMPQQYHVTREKETESAFGLRYCMSSAALKFHKKS